MKNIVAFITFIFLSQIIIAQEKRAMDPLDVANIKSVGAIIASEDGNWIAYTLSVQADPLEKNESAHNELYLMNLMDRSTVPFIVTGSVRSISFRPSKKAITFLEKKEEDKNVSLYEISLLGGEAKKILELDHSILFYEWEPGGDKVALITSEQLEIESELPYQPEIYEENLIQRKAQIFSFNDDNGKIIPIEGDFYTLHWSPNGNMLAASLAPTSLVDDSYMKMSVIIIDASTFQIKGKVDHSAKLGNIQWSPDGKKLAIIAGEDVHDPISGRLMVVSADGGTPMNIQPDFPGSFDNILWAENNTIAFIASEGVWSVMGTVKDNGSSLTRRVSTGGPVLDNFVKTKNGTYVFVVESPVHPHEIYIMKTGSDTPEKVTDHNPWLENIAFAPQEVVKYTARDGLEIQGLLIRPLNEKRGQTYPLITVVHGGPESHYDNGWITGYSAAGQVGAGMGFAVFYPNYRGSTGRGVKYTKSSQGDLAGKEFDDIVDGVDYLVENGLVDKDRVGVTGGSYGGYATGWLSTKYSDRFAAGVMFVGISDNISKWGTSDIPEELYLVHARKRIWEDYQFWLERSPIYYVDQAETPLLIMHGKNDTRVHPSQSMELYRHIKTRTDTPVRLVFYPGEGHGNRKSTARLDYNLRMLRWFEHYLQERKMDTTVELEIELKH